MKGRSADAIGAAGQVMTLNQPVDATRLAARDVILQAQAQLARRQAAAARVSVAESGAGLEHSVGQRPGARDVTHLRQRTAQASSSRRARGSPPAPRTETSPKPNS